MNEKRAAQSKSSKLLDQALQEQDFKGALELSESMLVGNEDDQTLMAIKGWCLHKTGDHKLAQEWLVKAFNHAPKEHYAASMLMSYYMERADYRQEVTLAQYCVGVHSQDRMMWHRLGTAQFMLGDVESAIIAFRRSLQVEYSDNTSFAISQPLLCQGKYQEGFERYDYRFAANAKLNWPQEEQMPMPRWQGESLDGKSLLVWTEQGFGDCLQFSRLITTLAEQGASVDLMLPPQHASLHTLLKQIEGVERVIVIKDKNVTLHRRYDYQSPMMSLMRWMELSTEQVPKVSFPYISLLESVSETRENQRLNDLLNSFDKDASKKRKLRVGLVWSTALFESFKQKDHLHFKQKEVKSLRSQSIEPILQIEGIEFVSLHVAKSPDVQHCLDNHEIVDAASCIQSFTDTAAIVEAMDLIISIDTSVAHLAGAMNKPVLNLLPYAADWRWQMNREDSPWYPSMRLLRQSVYNDWHSVSTRLVRLLPKIRDRFMQTNSVELHL